MIKTMKKAIAVLTSAAIFVGTVSMSASAATQNVTAQKSSQTALLS